MGFLIYVQRLSLLFSVTSDIKRRRELYRSQRKCIALPRHAHLPAARNLNGRPKVHFLRWVGNRRKEGYFDDPAKYRLNRSSLTWLLSPFRIDLSSYIVFGGPITFLIFFRPEFMSIYLSIYIEIDPFFFLCLKNVLWIWDMMWPKRHEKIYDSAAVRFFNKDFWYMHFVRPKSFRPYVIDPLCNALLRPTFILELSSFFFLFSFPTFVSLGVVMIV